MRPNPLQVAAYLACLVAWALICAANGSATVKESAHAAHPQVTETPWPDPEAFTPLYVTEDAPTPIDASAILDQVRFSKPPIGPVEVDTRGNILVTEVSEYHVTFEPGSPAEADAEKLADEALGAGTPCALSFREARQRTDGPFTLLCMPASFNLYNRLNPPIPTPAP